MSGHMTTHSTTCQFCKGELTPDGLCPRCSWRLCPSCEVGKIREDEQRCFVCQDVALDRAEEDHGGEERAEDD